MKCAHAACKHMSTSPDRSRDLLVGAALAAGLVPELLGRLEWRSARDGPAPAERDEAVERVLVVDVLRLMAAEGPHAPEVGPHRIEMPLVLSAPRGISDSVMDWMSGGSGRSRVCM